MATSGWNDAVATSLALRKAIAGPSRPNAASPRSVAGKPSIDLADALYVQIEALRLPLPMREYRPFTDRKFRIDLAWVDRLIAMEVDGGEWGNGRHGRGAGMQTDCEKQNRLTLEGWSCFRVTGSQVRSGYAAQILEQVFSGEETV